MAQYVLSLDQGTTSSRAMLFDHEGKIAGIAQHEFTQHFPKTGWVEHDPMDILTSQLNSAVEVLARARIRPRDVVALGITNQRETTLVWDRETGTPIYNAIVFNGPTHFSISCLKEARKGSSSDLKNRIFRPITRRWGICFRSHQRYTVCAETPRYSAACFTVNGYSPTKSEGLSWFTAFS